MKTRIIYIVLIGLYLTTQQTVAQNIGDLNGISYQAVAVDDNGKEIVGMDINGKPLYEKTISVRFSITKGLDGEIQWEEIHETVTDRYGLFTLTIGKGVSTGNGYSNMLEIPWIDADQFLKVELSIKNDGNYKVVSNSSFMSVPYSFYTDDIADNAITTAKILNEEILAEDIATGAVESTEILDETIISADIATSAVTTDELMDETILASDINTGAVESDEILDETILATDIASGAITTDELLDRTVQTGDIDTAAITSLEIKDNTIVNNDIANATIDLTSKVTGVLPVENGGTGNASYATDNVLVGTGTGKLSSKVLASADSSLLIIQTEDSIIFKSRFEATDVTASDPAGTFNVGNLPSGQTYVSNAINAFEVSFGDIIIASIDVNLQGCMLTAYVSQPNVIRIAIFNGTGSAVNLGNDIGVRVMIVK